MSEEHKSTSTEQQQAEALVRHELEAQLGVTLEKRSLQLPGGSRVEVDGVSKDNDVLVEIFVQQGRPKGAQLHKVARDALKLITVTRDQPNRRRILAFASQEAAAAFQNKSWLAEALTMWHVEIVVVELEQDIVAGLRAAQIRQVMVNTTD